MKYLMIFILSAIVSVSGFFYWSRDRDICHISVGHVGWSFEVADTLPKQTRGLMGRETLCANCGMIFVFEHEKPQAFWMKDTLIPLDIYFYDTNGTLVDQALNMRPERETKDPMIFHSKRPVQYVIEVQQGSDFYAPTLDFHHCNFR